MLQTNEKTLRPEAVGQARPGEKRAWVSPRVETIELRNAKSNPVNSVFDGFASSVH